MKRFHSSGTASGNVDVMWMWKISMPITAIFPSVPPLERSSSSGSTYSRTVPRWANIAASRDARRSSGWFRYRRFLRNRERFHGVLETITATTFGKWWLSFDDAAPHQTQNRTIWLATIIWSIGNRKTTSSSP